MVKTRYHFSLSGIYAKRYNRINDTGYSRISYFSQENQQEESILCLR